MIESPMRTPREQQLGSVTLRTWINERAERRGLAPVELFTYGIHDRLNLDLSSACAGSDHHLCNGAVVSMLSGEFWRCRCLHHYAGRVAA
jgi:hypothetical protein